MIYLTLLVVNILFLYFIKSDKKYWLLSVPLWTLLIASFILWRANTDKRVKKFEAEYWKTAENKEYGDYNKWTKLADTKKKMRRLNIAFVYIIGLQTLITFIFQVVGQMRTRQKTYKMTKIVFGILFGLVVVTVAMMGIVPTRAL